jgi:hypothetical protein
VIGADFGLLIKSHDKANGFALLVPEETNYPSPPFLPLRQRTVIPEKRGPPAFREKDLDYGCVDKGRAAHFEDDILIFLM